MALSIKNDELENRIRRLAEVSGNSLTGALRLAVDNELGRYDADYIVRLKKAREGLARIHAELAEGPTLGDFTDHDLYDEYGLPN